MSGRDLQSCKTVLQPAGPQCTSVGLQVPAFKGAQAKYVS